MVDVRGLEAAIWAVADGFDSVDDRALVESDALLSRRVLGRLIDDTEAALARVRRLDDDERDQAVADFLETLANLRTILARFEPPPAPAPEPTPAVQLPPEDVRLQASWESGSVVVWAAGRGTRAEPNDELATRLESIGGPALGWDVHPTVALPDGQKADALAIPMRAALGWLVALAGGDGAAGAGDSLLWLARVCAEGVRIVAEGRIVPGLHVSPRGRQAHAEAAVRWVPALLDTPATDALAAAMPGSILAVERDAPKAITSAIVTSVVDAIMAESAERTEVPAQPPHAGSRADLADTMVARLDGAPFRADDRLARALSQQLRQWSRPVTEPHARLMVRLQAPAPQSVWQIFIDAVTGSGDVVPLETALRSAQGRGSDVATEWARLARIAPVLCRSGALERGRIALTQAEAWEFMTDTGPLLSSIGFIVRAPEFSRLAARPSLRLDTEIVRDSKVGANQLSNVSWTAVFGDVVLTADEVARLAAQARPLLHSGGRWVAVDQVDLQQAASALADRAGTTQLTGAEILRYTVGLDGSGLAGRVVVHGDSWANEILARARDLATAPAIDVDLEHFVGELRSYQTEALAWIGFLDEAQLGGCLALDMGLGKTPTVLAHLARAHGDGTALVIAPAAVVGNWTAEAARFTPDLRVVVHHGTDRSMAEQLQAQIEGADVVITTYATAVRDIEALAAATWTTIVLDEAQAIKNPLSETAQQLRRIPARCRLALTGTPIENTVGDLWAILDYTNPGLLGARSAFIAQLSGDHETALHALNGILLFRRTKNEPEVAAELPDKIDELDRCSMTPEQIGLYQAVVDDLIKNASDALAASRNGAILAGITALKQICNHPAAYHDDDQPLSGRSGKLARLEEIIESVFAADERLLIFTHFASWGRRLAEYLSTVTATPIACYDGSLSRTTRDRLVAEFQNGRGRGAMVLSLKAGGAGLNLTAANHVVLYDRWWNPATEDQARDRAWRIGQSRTVISHRLVCPGTIDEQVEEIVAGKRHIAQLVLPRSSSIADLSSDQLRLAFGLRPDEVLVGDGS